MRRNFGFRSTQAAAPATPKRPFPNSQDRTPIYSRTWKDYLLGDTAILVWMAVALVALHCLTNNQYGFHRDELNFIEDGRHLAWGYVDCPPFTPFVAHIAEMLFGTSLVGIRFFPAVSQGLVLILTGPMVRRMGGNRWAQVYSAANPSSIYLWVLGLYFFWRSSGEPNYRPLVWMYAVPLAGFLALKGRGYYMAPAYPMLIAGGAYYIGEQVRNLTPVQRNARYSWLYYSLIIGGVCAASLSMPVVPLNSFWWKVSDNLHRLYREEVGWPEMVKTVADIRDTVPIEEHARLGILAGNYGEAGAINVYGPAYNLPRAISGIDSFWLWGYGDPPPETVIVLGLEPSYAYSLFETCSIAGINKNPYGIKNEESERYPYILLCRRLRQPWEEFWKDFHYFG